MRSYFPFRLTGLLLFSYLMPAVSFFIFPVAGALAQTKSRQQEKTELIAKTLTYALVQKQNLPTYSMVKNKKKIYVFDQMRSLSYPDSAAAILTKDMLPKLDGIKLELVSETDLMRQPLKNKDLFYLEIGKIDIMTTEAAVVDISANWILGKHSRKGGLGHRGAGGYSLVFLRENGSWSEGREIRKWDN